MPRGSTPSNGDGTSAFEEMMGANPPTEEVALAEVDENVQLSVVPTWTDEPDFDDDEMRFPRLRLGQGLTPEVAEGNAKMGQWLFTGFEPMNAITVVPIQVGRTRAKKEDPSKDDSPIVCKSPDGRQGYGSPGIACKVCPHSKWQPGGANGKNLPPACPLTWHYVVWIAEHNSIGEVTFVRTSEIKAQTINTLIKSFGFGRFALRLTHSIQKSPGRIWATPEVTMVPITEEMAEASGGLIQGPPPSVSRSDAPRYVDADAEVVPF